MTRRGSQDVCAVLLTLACTQGYVPLVFVQYAHGGGVVLGHCVNFQAIAVPPWAPPSASESRAVCRADTPEGRRKSERLRTLYGQHIIPGYSWIRLPSRRARVAPCAARCCLPVEHQQIHVRLLLVTSTGHGFCQAHDMNSRERREDVAGGGLSLRTVRQAYIPVDMAF